MSAIAPAPVYLFVDEAGNFDFTAAGTKYLVLTCVSRRRPIGGGADLLRLKYDLWEKGLAEVEYFHATSDRYAVRAAVWEIVAAHLEEMEIDSLVVEKRLLVPGLRRPEKLYPWAMSLLMRHVLGRVCQDGPAQVMVVTDRLPIGKHKAVAEKSIHAALSQSVSHGSTFRLAHHASMSNPELQVADYINWAIFRKWERADTAPYAQIGRSICSEHDVFGPRREGSK